MTIVNQISFYVSRLFFCSVLPDRASVCLKYIRSGGEQQFFPAFLSRGTKSSQFLFAD